MFGTTRREAVKNHLYALENYSPKNNYLYIDGYNGLPTWLENYHIDAIILHNTFLCLRNNMSFARLTQITKPLTTIQATKIAIPQDEYDMSDVLDRWLQTICISTIFSNFSTQQETLYPLSSKKSQVLPALTGYIAPSLLKAYDPSIKKQWKIGYRAAHLPYWFGSLGQYKYEIGHHVKNYCQTHNISHNIDTSEFSTFYGKKWYHFLQSSEAVLGCESGSSLLVRDNTIKEKTKLFLTTHPSASFETTAKACFPGEDNQFLFTTISPRHLECAALRVCQILLEGQYDGLLNPYEHYLPLKKDFSNIKDIIALLKNKKLLDEITENAYTKLVVSKEFHYDSFSKNIINKIIIDKNNRRHLKPPITQARTRNHYTNLKNKWLTKRFFYEAFGYLKQYFPKISLFIKKQLKRQRTC